MKQMENMKT